MPFTRPKPDYEHSEKSPRDYSLDKITYHWNRLNRLGYNHDEICSLLSAALSIEISAEGMKPKAVKAASVTDVIDALHKKSIAAPEVTPEVAARESAIKKATKELTRTEDDSIYVRVPQGDEVDKIVDKASYERALYSEDKVRLIRVDTLASSFRVYLFDVDHDRQVYSYEKTTLTSWLQLIGPRAAAKGPKWLKLFYITADEWEDHWDVIRKENYKKVPFTRTAKV